MNKNNIGNTLKTSANIAIVTYFKLIDLLYFNESKNNLAALFLSWKSHLARPKIKK